MLSVRIHLDHILVAFPNRIFISKLQPASITKIKYMGHYLVMPLLRDIIRGIQGRIIHNQDVCDLCDLRLFQLFQ